MVRETTPRIANGCHKGYLCRIGACVSILGFKGVEGEIS